MTPAALLDRAIDALLAEHGCRSEVVAARRYYEERRGKVHQDEELWERWSTAFVEWYVLEWTGSTAGSAVPPAVRTWQEATAAGDTERADVVAALLRSHRSIFAIERMGSGEVGVRDLVGGAQFQVHEPRALPGVNVGDIVEMRLVGYHDQVLFARTFIFHPCSAREAILEQVRHHIARGVDRLEIVDRIAALRVKISHYRNVPPARVYEMGSRHGL